MKIAYKLDNLCRLCLNQVGETNIFDPVDMTTDIFTITGLKVVQHDPLPQTVCKKCMNIVKDAIQLGLCSKKNDSYLKYLLFNESDYNCHDEVPYQNTFDVPNMSMENDSQESKISNNENTLSTSLNDDSNFSEQKLTIREDIYNNEKMEVNFNEGLEKSCPTNDYNSLIVKDEAEEDESLLVPIKNLSTTSSIEEDQLFTYECEKCYKIFNTRKKLTLHARTHKKKYKCPHEDCEKKFACKNDLYKHIRCHTGERPYQCDLCDWSFTQNGTLKSHKINIHGTVQTNLNRRPRSVKFESKYLPNHSGYKPLMFPNDTTCVEEQSSPPYESKFLITNIQSRVSMEGELTETIPFEVQMSTTPQTALKNEENDSQLLSPNVQCGMSLSPGTERLLQRDMATESPYFTPTAYTIFDEHNTDA